MSEQLVIKNGFLLTMDKDFTIIENGAVVVEDDKIIDVGKTSQIEKNYKADNIINAKHKVIMPGLVDLHYHSSLGRGMYDALPLFVFLDALWYPKIRAMSPEEAYWGALCGYSEAIKSGTTSVNDQWRQMESCADAAAEIGIRAVLSSDVAIEEAKLDTCADNERLYNLKNGIADDRVRVFFGVESIPITSREIMDKTRELADRYHTGIHIHLNEAQSEIDMSLKRHKLRPTVLANETGVLGSDCVAAHCVLLSDEEIELMKKTGTHISHNPTSNAKLGNGIARLPEYLKAEINVGIGHDSATCNNSVDLFEAMKWVALIHRGARADASLMPTKTVLRMATANGGVALNQKIGIIKPGYKADIILVDLIDQHFIPTVYGSDTNIPAHLVYSAHGENVDTTIIDGKIVMKNRKLTTVNESEILEKANKSFMSVFERVKNNRSKYIIDYEELAGWK